jgi:tetratricopeptide (TPR) repeat protein
MFCENCGKEVPGESKLCLECGETIQKDLKDNTENLGMMIYKDCLRTHPEDAGTYFLGGNVYYDNGRYARSIELYAKAIIIMPGYYKAYLNLGIAYIAKGDNDKAIKALREARDHSHPEAYYWLGVAFENKGDHRIAGNYFRRSERYANEKAQKDLWE